jgi:hypothetical protein
MCSSRVQLRLALFFGIAVLARFLSIDRRGSESFYRRFGRAE